MKKYLITFRSITLAQRAERALLAQGVRCHIRRTPRWMEKKGCGYAVEASMADVEYGLALLREQGIVYRNSYRLSQDGTPEELGL